MSQIIPFPDAKRGSLTTARRYEIFVVEDDSLVSIGINSGDEFIVVLGEFTTGDFHVIEARGCARVRKLGSQIPGLVGRVLRPPASTEAARSAS